MQMLNIQDVVDSVDAYTVARYIGMDVIHKGKYKFILCPGHESRTGHPDTNASNCVLTEKGYHCFGCNKTVSMINMVMEFTGRNFKDSLIIVAEAAGGVELFKSNYSAPQTKLPLTQEELNIIGLSVDNKNCYYVNKDNDVDFENPDYLYFLEENEVLLSERSPKGLSLHSLYKTNRKLYNQLILNKSKTAIERYDAAIQDFGSRGGRGAKRVYELFSENDSLSGDVFTGIKNVLLKKRAIAQKIYDEYSKNVDI